MIRKGQLESAWVAEQIGRPVIKAFNNILAPSLATKTAPAGAGGRLALSVAGDPGTARAKVLRARRRSDDQEVAAIEHREVSVSCETALDRLVSLRAIERKVRKETK